MPHDFLIEPLAPLVFRSGKPFGAQAGADGAAFPPPSSLAGLVRTLHAEQHGTPFSGALREIAVAGPLLARRAAGGALTPLCPKPADAIYLKEGEQPRVLRLRPAALPDGTGCDLPDGLLPLRMDERLDGKPLPGPQFWPLDALLAWGGGAGADFSDLQRRGEGALAAEERMHVSLDRVSQAADDGRLFQTGGLDLAPRRQGDGWQPHDLVFVGRADVALDGTLAIFGGERRLSRLHGGGAQRCWPAAPAGLEAQVRVTRGLRLTLATPAIFAGGYRPGWLDAGTLEGSPPGCPELRLRLRAAAVERWLPVSGWDLAKQKPRAMRKAAAPGAVYWFELLADPPAGFLDALWLAPLSDHPQDRRDGFGLCVPAPWSAAQS